MPDTTPMREWHYEVMMAHVAKLELEVSRIEQSEREKLDLIRKLKDETNSHEVFERCKRVLGEQ